MRLGGKETLKRLEESTKKLPKTIIKDEQMLFLCERFMNWTKKDFRSHKSEITPAQLSQRTMRFCAAYGMKDSELLWELQKLGFVEVSAGYAFLLRYDKVRR